MPRVPYHDVDSAPEASRDALKRQSERVGRTINIFKAMAHSPAVINLYDTAEHLLGDVSNLDAATREAIHLTIANVNGCDYCQAAYTGAAKNHGFSEAQTVQIRTGGLDGDDKLTALLAVAREIVPTRLTATRPSERTVRVGRRRRQEVPARSMGPSRRVVGPVRASPRAGRCGMSTGGTRVNVLVTINGAAYGSELPFNGLRLARTLAKRDGVQMRVFLMGDAVVSAVQGHDLPEGFYHLDRMVRSVGRRGEVGCCGTCLNARGIGDGQLVDEAFRSTMDQLADWTLEADRIVGF